MKRNLLSAYLTDEEVEEISEIKKSTKWCQTEIASFFVRLGMKNYKLQEIKDFDNDIAQALVEATFTEYSKTDTYKIQLQKAIDEKMKEIENVRSCESA
jgi:hypothetical protein